MTDKPTGARAAAERIYCQEAGISHKELIGLRQVSDRPNIRIREIEATILKHHPKEKRLTRWLLEIVNEILERQDPYSERGIDYSVVPKKLLQQLRAVYTGLNHCPEDKEVDTKVYGVLSQSDIAAGKAIYNMWCKYGAAAIDGWHAIASVINREKSPEKKAIGKLVDIAQRVNLWGQGSGENIGDIVKDARIAIAEYEGKQNG